MAQRPAQNPTPGTEPGSRLARVAQRRGRLLTLLVTVAALASFGGVIYWAHEKDRESGGEGIVPLIRADDRPIKIRPDAPGGMVVPNQEKTVYERISPGSVPQGPERLLAPPPTPQIQPAVPPQLVTPAQEPAAGAAEGAADAPPAVGMAPGIVLPPPEPGAPSVTDVLTAPSPAAPADQPAQSAASQPVSQSSPQTAQPSAEPAAQPAAPPQASQSIATLIDQLSGHRIQLASVRTEEQARATWARLQQSNGDVLGELTMRAVRVELGDRGVFYRVQAGPLEDAAAQAACSKLRSRSIECLVVRP